MNERYRLTLKSYQGRWIFRLQRWVQRDPEGAWTAKALEGLSLSPDQAQALGEGIAQGLFMLSGGISSGSTPWWRGNDD